MHEMEPAVSALPAGGLHRGPGSRLFHVLLVLQRAWSEFLGLLLPVDCIVCGTEDTSLCRTCAAEVRASCLSPFRAEQQAPALTRPDGSVLLPVVAGGWYRNELAAVLLAFKNHGRTDVAAVLAGCLAAALVAAPERGLAVSRPLLLVPVPTSGRSFRRRGYDPLRLLLNRLVRSGALECVAVSSALCQRRRWPWQRTPQKGLGRAARRANVRSSLRVPRRKAAALAGFTLLIIDDVLTTGATLSEAARALESAGGVVAGAVVLAVTRSPRNDSEPAGNSQPTGRRNNGPKEK